MPTYKLRFDIVETRTIEIEAASIDEAEQALDDKWNVEGQDALVEASELAENYLTNVLDLS